MTLKRKNLKQDQSKVLTLPLFFNKQKNKEKLMLKIIKTKITKIIQKKQSIPMKQSLNLNPEIDKLLHTINKHQGSIRNCYQMSKITKI